MIKIKLALVIAIILLELPSCTKSGSEVTLDLCSFKSNSNDSIAALIIQEQQQVGKSVMVGQNQTCVMEIANNLATAPTDQHYKALEILAHYADASVREYMMDVSVRLLENTGAQFADYLAANQDGALYQLVVHGIATEMEMCGEEKDILRERMGATLKTEQQRETVDEIFEKISSGKLD